MNKPAKISSSFVTLQIAILLCFVSAPLPAGDWPQWRGANRDAKATGFNAPKTWPKELTQKWKIAVGDGVATPVLVGNKLYVFTRQEEFEIVRCLNEATGKEIWQEIKDKDSLTLWTVN